MKKTGLVWGEIFKKHLEGVSTHPEKWQRLKAIYDTLSQKGIADKCIEIPLRKATEDEIMSVHGSDYYDMVKQTEGVQMGSLDVDTWTTDKSFEAALIAAGSGVDLVDRVYSGELDNGFVIARPPGHHAVTHRSMGFCIFNSIAIAAEHLVRNKNAKKIAIVDYDVHHGNGTNNTFSHRNDVLYISTHQMPLFPGTGYMSDMGAGEGEGDSVNIPLRTGLDNKDFFDLYTHLVVKILEQYQPEIILVSSGMDIHKDDPIGGMRTTTDGIAEIGQILIDCAEKLCNGKIAFFLEGGYDLDALSTATYKTMQILLGQKRFDVTNDRELSSQFAIEAIREFKERHDKWKL